ncbi:bifunctional 2',3'-cyclic-nucleotide 2'-phosphodiesterase/3'-nucleotidase [Rhodanobacter sp. DHG33]|uniref:bifunctional 2',3'-cyclic-nucleotide 2'-phosphodiesterase/3'-nucleotidase n=1 Tax=Rhodanobacter sp. DHG33 TaxID=2775921 RepID=UPI001781377C|nr:bifunctional 2',3'-cyclic-nucleotide 2'-phosphodiesterase/3'-nucleotidase [Rhodanobacter sp. DHG33]MBD8897796.1 bifunctional 2',3'-cyclic-nucleotide 2'-phosphodiesterase/3'-nucleotidase [Rhodanobacter sp. DHG33]
MSPHRSTPALLATALIAACALQPSQASTLPDGARATVAILETTDLHSNILGYDYYKQKADPTLGFERTATLIEQARKQFPNNFLFDSGDTIQGTVLADWQAQVQKMPCDGELAIYRAMDAVGYDGGTIGNHEFNYGLGWLSQVTGTPMNVDGGAHARCDGPHFPLVLSNVDSVRDGKPIFRPWTMVTKDIAVTLPGGKTAKVPLRVAIIGFTPPPIMDWDKRNLEGKVAVDGVVEAAKKYLSQIQAQHPDLVVALVHGGLDTAPYTPALENAGWYLAGVPGIDVLLLGHSHTEFPGPRFASMKDVDDVRGFVRGKPAVMGGFFGKDLGVVELALDYQGGRWNIDDSQTHSEVRPICAKAGDAASCTAADPAIAPLVAKVQQSAVAYVNTPIGRSDVRLSSYFADEGDMSALAVVNAAQRDYVRTELPRQHPELAKVPVLSAAAAFRTGFGGPDDYTDVAPGPLTLRSAADLYFYPNTLAAVKTDGAGVKAWLEKSAERFNRIDPAKTDAQPLINTRYPGFNFDQMQGGIQYVIDVSKPEGQRITSLAFDGKPVQPDQPFIVVTNNYRASGGGHFPGLDGSSIVLAAPDGTREIVAHWITQHREITAHNLPAGSWRFAPLKTAGPVTFGSAAGKQDVVRADGIEGIRQVKDNGDGTAIYAIDLSH